MISILVGTATAALLLAGAGFAALGGAIKPSKVAGVVSVGQSGAGGYSLSVPPPAPPSATPPAVPTPAPTDVTAAAEASPVPTGTPSAVRPATGAGAPGPRTVAGAPVPSTCGAPANPYGFTFCAGTQIHWADLPGDICAYLTCVPTFWWHATGYLVQCRDGRYSMSGGLKDACWRHGGAWRQVHRHR